MERNILLTIEYDGTGFAGWQRQPAQRTVQGELYRVLSVLCAPSITLDGASRTDAGVHAFGQRATLRGSFGIPTDRIPYAANNLLSNLTGSRVPDVRIVAAADQPEGFHARFDCKGKKYLYRIENTERADLMKRNFCYHVPGTLDLSAMQEAADVLIGEHDFRAFMSAGGNGSAEGASTVRRIDTATISINRQQDTAAINAKAPQSTETMNAKAPQSTETACAGQEIVFEVSGSGFLYNMVRILTGTLIEIGQGKRSPMHIEAALKSLDRKDAGHTAPPQGLYLSEIYY